MDNGKFTMQNRQKDVKDELNVDRMKYAAYLDEDKDPRSQKNQFLNAGPNNQMAAIEAYLGVGQDGANPEDLPTKSRHTLDYLHLT